MTTPPPGATPASSSPRSILLISVLLAAGWFALTRDVGLNLADEGYLWHDIQQTFEGGVPIRDFRAYDPGRYYMGALWFSLAGPGIMSLRGYLAAIQAVGLAFGLLALKRVIRGPLHLAAVGFLCLLWTVPLEKRFDHSLIMMGVFGVVWLIEAPTTARHFAIGLMVGVSGVIGRNYGVYMAIGFGSLIAFRAFAEAPRSAGKAGLAWAAGIVSGYLPVILMLLYVTGFRTSFVDSISRLAGPYSPVKSLPVPWPWSRPLPWWHGVSASAWLLGWMFLLLVILHVANTYYVLRSGTGGLRNRPLCAAACFIGVPTLYQLFSRADFAHLTQGFFPALVCLVEILAHSRNLRAGMARSALLVTAVPSLALLTLTPLLNSTDLSLAIKKVGTALGLQVKISSCQIDGHKLWLRRSQAAYIEAVRRFCEQNIAEGEGVLIAPYQPGLYQILGRASPIWDPYPIHLASEQEQKEIIRALADKSINWALIDDSPMDSLDERRFSRTHALVYEYLVSEFEEVPSDIPGPPKVFHRRRDRNAS
ncbi:MAG: hypothetical protein AB1714_17470 [Acidobacteriota bacterium]